MSRRIKSTEKLPKSAFLPEETAAVVRALGKLYRRSIFHLVEPKFPRPLMADVWRTFIPEEDWAHMAKAQVMMVMPSNTWQYFAFTDRVEIPGSNTGLPAKIEIKTKRLLPCRQGLPDPVIPEAYVEFVRAATEMCTKWVEVYMTYTVLNETSTRLTAGYHWPCASALMTLGGRPAADLSECTRPGTIGGELARRCRDTSSFVMQHMLLPPIDVSLGADYEGDEETGLAARLLFTVNHAVYGNVIWPLRD